MIRTEYHSYVCGWCKHITNHTVLIYVDRKVTVCMDCQQETITGDNVTKEYTLLSISDELINVRRRFVKAKVLEVVKNDSFGGKELSREVIEVSWPAYEKKHYTTLVEGKDKKLSYDVAGLIGKELKKYVDGDV